MTELLYMTFPYLGSISVQRDTITLYRFELEVIDCPPGREYLLCLGSLRTYLTPRRTILAERRGERR